LLWSAPPPSFVDLDFSLDGNWLGEVSSKNTVHLWYAPSWEEIEKAEGKR
jgi:hypothetical protein